jgi:hypothetical protein
MGFKCIDCKEWELYSSETYPNLCYKCYLNHHISLSQKKQYDLAYEKVKDNWIKLCKLQEKYRKQAWSEWQAKNNN